MADRVRQKVASHGNSYVAGRDLFISGNVEASAVPGLLPRDVPQFTGRQAELARLIALADGGQVAVTVIGGTGGVGKTTLAVHAAHQLLEQFPDGHLYADLRGYTEGQVPVEPGEALDVFLRRLGVPTEQLPVDIDERAGMYRSLLAKRRMLVLLDNAGSEAQVRRLLPGTGGSLVLITSRSFLPALDADERISLDVLPVKEATEMLAGIIGTARATAEPEAVSRVAQWCGWLPLALRIAGQVMAAHPTWPVRRLERMLADERERLASLKVGDLHIRVTFEVSYRQLPYDDARMFRLLSLHPGPSFSVLSAATLAGIEPEDAEPILGRLADVYLITDDGFGRLGLHDLLRLFARETCEGVDEQAARDAAAERLVYYYAVLTMGLASSLTQQLPADAKRLGTELLAPNDALAVFEAERASLLPVVYLAMRLGKHEDVLSLCQFIAPGLTALRYFDDDLAISEAGVSAARHIGVGAEGGALVNLGESHRRLGHFQESMDYSQQALTIFRSMGDRYGEGVALNNLGLAFVELRQLEEAVQCFEHSIAIQREIRDRHGEGQTLINLGAVYRGLGHIQDAIACYERALTIFQETGDRHGEAQTLNNLGNAYADLRQFEKAVNWVEQAIAIYRETGDRYGEGAGYKNLGVTYRELRQPDRAAACWRQAAAILRDIGEDDEAARLERAASQLTRRPWWHRSKR
jgi:tetratricopeptide (TPR) repeat protein